MLPKHRLWFRLLRTGPGRRQSARALPWPVWGQCAWGDAPFGRGSLAKNGCEVLSARWALALCGRKLPAEQVILAYEQSRKLLLWGKLGCDPYALPEVLPQYGLQCEEFTDFSTFCHAVEQDGVYQLSYWVTNRLWGGAHGVTLCRRDDRLWVFNRHNRQAGPAEIPSLCALTDEKRFLVGYKIT